MPRLWQIWLLACVLLLAIKLPFVLQFQAHDPDDYMRLLQVRDWLAGQDWFDTRQYRMNPPFGADVHWVRLGDLPLALVLLPLQFVLPQHVAEAIAMTVVPLLPLLLAMLFSRALMRGLGMSRAEQLAGLVLLPLLPMPITSFAPLRVDYHGWQGVFALAMVALIVRDGERRRLAAGVVAALWLTLSLEGLLVVIGCGGWLALGYWLYGRRGHDAYFAGLAAGSIVLTLIFRPPADFVRPYCDVLSSPHIAAFSLSAVLMNATRFVRAPKRRALRLIELLPTAVAAALAIYLPLGRCAISPLANIDPLAREVFFDVFLEASPVHDQPASVVVMLVWTLGLILMGCFMILRRPVEPQFRTRWATLLAVALVSAAASLLVVRAGVVTQLLAVPFCAVLLMRWLPAARAISRPMSRIGATLACLALFTPILPTALSRLFDRPQHFELAASPYLRDKKGCEFQQLRRLPPSQLFTPIAVTPYLLTITPHSVVAGTYHRNDREIRDVIMALSGPVDQAPAILHKYRADYVVLCLDDIEVPYLASRGDGGLVRQALQGDTPTFLEPVLGFAGNLRVYRVK